MSIRHHRCLVLCLVACLAVVPWVGAAAPPARPRLDWRGDPLPAGALARIGSVRLQHPGFLLALAFSPDSKTLVSSGGQYGPSHRDIGLGGEVGTIRLWDARTGRPLRSFVGHGRLVHLVAFSGDGKILAAADYQGIVRLWDFSSAKETGRIAVPPFIGGMALARDGKTLAATSNQAVMLWNVATRKELRRWQVPGQVQLGPIAFSPDGKMLAAAATSGTPTIFLWDTETGRLLHELKRPAVGVTTLSFSTDGKILVADGSDLVRFWDPKSGKELPKLDKLLGRVCLSPSGREVAGLESGSSLVLVERRTGKRLWSCKLPGYSFSLAFAPDGKSLACGVGQAIWLFDAATGKNLVAPTTPAGPIAALDFSPDGRFLALAAERLQLWDASTWRPLPLAEHSFQPSALAFAPDSRSLVVGSFDQTIRLWSVPQRKELRQFTGDIGQVEYLTFLGDGRTLASMSRHRRTTGPGGTTFHREMQVRFWDVAAGKQARAVGDVMMQQSLLSPDGKRLATALNQVQLWDVPSGRRITQIAYDVAQTHCLAFSPDGRLLACSLYNQRTRKIELVLWEVESAQLVCRFEVGEITSFALAFSPSGGMLAAGGSDGAVRLWDVWTGEERRCLRGHQNPVVTLAFAPDGTRLVSGSQDATALVWDVADLPARRTGPTLPAEEMKAAWANLGGQADKAFALMRRLLASPRQAETLLAGHLRPIVAPDGRRVAQLLKDLGSDDFDTRSRAMDQLTRFGESVRPSLRKALDSTRDVDVRLRLQVILRKLEPEAGAPERLRQIRALRLLEHLGTAGARKQLKALGSGADGWVTREAGAILKRLKRIEHSAGKSS